MKYITGIPNSGAGIGHAFTDWAKALIIAKEYNLKFLHSPFRGNNLRWESMLGLSRIFTTFSEADYDLVLNQSDLSLDEYLSLNLKSLRSVYILDGNTPESNSKRFYSYESVARCIRYAYLLSRRNRPFFSPYHNSKLRIALHIRRGNITEYQEFKDRVLPYEYYENILDKLYKLAPRDSLDVLLITNDQTRDAEKFSKDHGARMISLGVDLQDFDVLANANIMITSNSGFSYLASLINIHSIKIVSNDFWHTWPKDSYYSSCLSSHDSLTQILSRVTRPTLPAPSRAIQRFRCTSWDQSIIPSAILTSSVLRDSLIDNSSTHASIFSVVKGRFVVSSSGESPMVAMTRRFLGAFVDVRSREVQLHMDIDDYLVIKDRPVAFIDFSSLKLNNTMIDSLIACLKTRFNEMLMGRTIMLPFLSDISIGDLSKARFHSSIKIMSLPPLSVYCSDIIAIKLEDMAPSMASNLLPNS